MSILTIFNLVIFAALLSFLYQLSKKKIDLSKLVLFGLLIGTAFGAYLQIIFLGVITRSLEKQLNGRILLRTPLLIY